MPRKSSRQSSSKAQAPTRRRTPRAKASGAQPSSQQPVSEQSQQQTQPAPPVEEIVAFVQSLKQSRSKEGGPSLPQATARTESEAPLQPSVEESHHSTSGPQHFSQEAPSTNGRRRNTRQRQSPRRTQSPSPQKSKNVAAAEVPPKTDSVQLSTQPQNPTKVQSTGKHTSHQKKQQETPQHPAPKSHTPPKRTFLVRDLTSMPPVPDACISLIERIETCISNEFGVEPGATILVAVSGGVDSVTLLDVLYILSFEHGYTLHIAHVNHKLRGEESDRDEAFVRTLAKQYDLPCHVSHTATDQFARKHRLSIEEAARELRYRFLRQMCGTVHASYCAVAHTADDSAETLLLNLFRGTGLTGLGAIPPKRALTKKAQLIRPLLGITRQEILDYATARSLTWIEDSSNTNRRHLRNRIRHDVLPLLKETVNPRIVETLQRTATILRAADGFIESVIESIYCGIVTERDSRIELDRAQLAAMHPFMQGEIIERAIKELTGKPASQAAVERVRSLLTAEVGTRASVTGTLYALCDRAHVVLASDATVQAVYLPIFKLGTYSIGRYTITLEEVTRNEVRLGTDRNVEYFDYDLLPYRLFLRTWQAGDRFAPLGMHGQEVLVAEFLTNAKVSELERRSALVLATATEIVWLCGYRMSEHFKLTNDTRRIIRATFYPE